jgi:hypothetical protein
VRRSAGRRFLVGVLAIAAFGFAVRVAYLVHLRGRRVDGDGNYYHVVSNLVASGHGFVLPTTAASHYVRTAAHPPMWTLTLALFARLGVHSFLSQQIVAAGVAAATIVVIGYAGRRIAGPSVGLIAATIAAVAPTFFFYEWELLSETLAMLLVAGVLLVAYRFRDRPSIGGALTVGVLCGLLALTHSDQGLLVVFLLWPLVLLARGVARRTRWLWLAAGTAAAIVVVAPWAIYNTARFHDPVLLSTEFGATLAEANCATTYSGPRFGWADTQCRLALADNFIGPGQDESTRDTALRGDALDFVRGHLGRVPAVIAAREGRSFGWYRPGQQIHFDAARGTPASYVRVGFFVTWALEIAAVGGVVVLRRRRVAVYPLVVVIGTAAIGVALTYAQTRYRASADVAIALLAAAGIDAAVRLFARRAGLTPQAPARGRAGAPTTVDRAGTSSTTTALAPTRAPSPTVIGPMILAPVPICAPRRMRGPRKFPARRPIVTQGKITTLRWISVNPSMTTWP